MLILGYEPEAILEPLAKLTADDLIERLGYIETALLMFRDFTFEVKGAKVGLVI